MKKLMVTLCILLALLCSTAVAADSTTHTLEDAELTLTIPGGYHILTRENLNTDYAVGLLDLLGSSAEEAYSSFVANNTHLNAFAPDLSHTLTLQTAESYSKDFSQLNNEELQKEISALEYTFSQMGAFLSHTDVYSHEQTKFAALHWSASDGTTPFYALQYSTVFGGQGIHVTLLSYTGPVTDEQEAMMQAIVDSITFHTPVPSGPTGPFVFRDETGSLSFQVPDGWVQQEPSEEMEHLQVQFSAPSDPGGLFQYICVDLWEHSPALKHPLMTRARFDTDWLLGEEGMALLNAYSPQAAEFERVSYGGRDFLRAQVPASDNTPDLPSGSVATMLYCVENANLHAFLFLSTPNSPAYAGFEALMDSVELTPPFRFSDHFNLLNLLLSLLLTVAVCALPIVIYRYAVRKTPMEKSKAQNAAILYGIASCILMCALLYAFGGSVIAVAAAVLWSPVNFRVLSGGAGSRVKTLPEETA